MNTKDITLEDIMTSGATVADMETMLSKYIRLKHDKQERELFERIDLENCTIPELMVINTTQLLKYTAHKQSYIDNRLACLTTLPLSEPVLDYCLSVIEHLEVEDEDNEKED